MWTFTIRLLQGRPMRLGMTVGGVAVASLLMGFLLALYRGVEEGSVAYLRDAHADAWVLQQHTTNILRGFSVLTGAHGVLLSASPDVRDISPLVFRLTSVSTPRGTATIYLTGFDPQAPIGSPRRIVAGRTVQGDGELVVDEAFARRWGIRIGDALATQEMSLHVVGFSGGTNMVVIQYGFATLNDVRALYGIGDLVSVYAVRWRSPQNGLPALDVPGAALVSNGIFLEQNLREMRSGFLPVLLVLAIVGIVALGAIIGLLLMLDLLERRTELAVLKAIGAPVVFLPAAVVVQALSVATAGLAVAALVALPFSSALRVAAPEVAALVTGRDLAMLIAGLLVLAAASTILPLRRLRTIYPTEAFL